jgi:hypothetical protein
MNRQEGSAEFGALIILFFLASLAAGSAIFLSANMTYFQRNSHNAEEKHNADVLLREIVAEMQPLKNFEYDDERNVVLDRLTSAYAAYGLGFTDLSSGFHLDFLTDADLQEKNLREYLFTGGNAANFIAWRETNGLSTDKNKWRLFLKEEALRSCVSYGYIHDTQTDSFAFRSVSRSFNNATSDQLFPLVNGFPLININMAPVEILSPLIRRPSFKIEKAELKLETLENKLLQGPVMISDISSFLDIPKDHALFGYLGTKTAFWEIVFQYRPGMYVTAVVAAVPVKDGEIQEIDEYRLIDRSIHYEP